METGKIKPKYLNTPKKVLHNLATVCLTVPHLLLLFFQFQLYRPSFRSLAPIPSSILPQELCICCSICMKKTCLLTFRFHFAVHHFFRETSFASRKLPFKHTHSFLCCAKPPFVALLTDIIKKLIGGDLWEYTGLS